MQNQFRQEVTSPRRADSRMSRHVLALHAHTKCYLVIFQFSWPFGGFPTFRMINTCVCFLTNCDAHKSKQTPPKPHSHIKPGDIITPHVAGLNAVLWPGGVFEDTSLLVIAAFLSALLIRRVV